MIPILLMKFSVPWRHCFKHHNNANNTKNNRFKCLVRHICGICSDMAGRSHCKKLDFKAAVVDLNIHNAKPSASTASHSPFPCRTIPPARQRRRYEARGRHGEPAARRRRRKTFTPRWGPRYTNEPLTLWLAGYMLAKPDWLFDSDRVQFFKS